MTSLKFLLCSHIFSQALTSNLINTKTLDKYWPSPVPLLYRFYRQCEWTSYFSTWRRRCWHLKFPLIYFNFPSSVSRHLPNVCLLPMQPPVTFTSYLCWTPCYTIHHDMHISMYIFMHFYMYIGVFCLGVSRLPNHPPIN